MFIDELKNDFKSFEIKNKITIISSNFIVIEGYKKLVTYKENLIEYLPQKTKVKIQGKNLKIVKINIQELYIKGTVDKVIFDEE